MYSNFEVRTSE